jgi:predicted O-linked N-acetylglucosamine transferase (SPINDLY family)
LAKGYVTFGSFNNLAKVNEQVLRCWGRILRAVPNSRILIKCKPFASATVCAKMWARFAELGVESERVDLVSLLPTTAEHLESYSNVDISVDTFPYAGTTTTCEALYCGVPVVTFARGCTAAVAAAAAAAAAAGSNASASAVPMAQSQFSSSQPQHPSASSSSPSLNHAHNVGATLLSRLPSSMTSGLIASSEDEYVSLAVALAQDIPKLQSLRASLRPAMLASPICDGRTFVGQLTDTYERLWQRFVRGEAPVPANNSMKSNA